MSTFLGHTRHVPVVTFRVSAAQRAEREREAEALGISLNELARRRFLAPSERRVDTEDSAPAARAERDLTVEYDPVEDVVSENRG